MRASSLLCSLKWFFLLTTYQPNATDCFLLYFTFWPIKQSFNFFLAVYFPLSSHSFPNLILFLCFRIFKLAWQPIRAHTLHISAKTTSHIITNIGKWYFYYRKLDKLRTSLIVDMYKNDWCIRMIKKRQRKNFFALNFLLKKWHSM